MLYSRLVHLSSSALATWCLAIFLEVIVFVLALRWKAAKELPFFVAYLGLLLVNEAILFGTYEIAGFYSRTSLYVYWTMQALCISLRAIVVYEICRRILSPFAGIWRALKPLLIGLAALLLGLAVLSSRGRPYHLTNAILSAQRGLELMVAALLIAGLAFCRYYGVRPERHLAWIALGLGLYSIAQIGDNLFLQNWSGHWLTHFAIWDALRHYSFDITLLMWMWALKEPLPAEQPAPALLSGNEYQTLSPVITLRLRELNARLLEMWK